MTTTVPLRSIGSDQFDFPTSAAGLISSLHLESDNQEKGRELIKADALALSKWVAGLVGAGGALSGTLAAIVAWTVSAGQEPLKIALAATSGLIIAVTITVVGWVTVTDVRARARTQQARYVARTDVVHDYMDLVNEAHGWPPSTRGRSTSRS